MSSFKLSNKILLYKIFVSAQTKSTILVWKPSVDFLMKIALFKI